MSTVETWRHRAQCIDWYPQTFFEDVWPTEEDPTGPNFDSSKLEACRTVCSRCPVRRECYGEIACPNWCDIDRTMPPIDDRGDRWTRRHTTLARKVLRWLNDGGYRIGFVLPRPSTLADEWKDRRNDMIRVYEALVADGTLAYDPRKAEYWYCGKSGAFMDWEPPHLAAA